MTWNFCTPLYHKLYILHFVDQKIWSTYAIIIRALFTVKHFSYTKSVIFLTRLPYGHHQSVKYTLLNMML